MDVLGKGGEGIEKKWEEKDKNVDKLLMRRRRDTLEKVDKKRVDEIARREFEVYQRFLIYQYKLNFK